MVVIQNEACPVTGQQAHIEDGTFDGWRVYGPFTAGGYCIEFLLIDVVRALPWTAKAKLKTWIVDQHRAGVEFPAITDEILDSLPHRRDLSYEQKVIRFFLMLREENVGLGSTFRFFGAYGEEDAATLPMRGKAMAWLGLAEAGQLSQMLLALEEEQLVRNQVGNLSLTPDGLRRLDQAMKSNESSDQAFVAMWFSAEMEEPYVHGFELGIADKGYRALRIDKKEHANKIDDEIIAEIRRSRFVVADFTCELIKDGQQIKPAARGGVYYEAGFAQGLNIPVIWTVRSDCIEHVHFDTRQYAHIVWDDAEDLRAKLANRIGALFGDFSA